MCPASSDVFEKRNAISSIIEILNCLVALSRSLRIATGNRDFQLLFNGVLALSSTLNIRNW